MIKHFKDKLIEDDKQYGEIDDYIGPGIFVALAIIVMLFTVMMYVFGKIYLS